MPLASCTHTSTSLEPRPLINFIEPKFAIRHMHIILPTFALPYLCKYPPNTVRYLARKLIRILTVSSSTCLSKPVNSNTVRFQQILALCYDFSREIVQAARIWAQITHRPIAIWLESQRVLFRVQSPIWAGSRTCASARAIWEKLIASRLHNIEI